MNLFIETPQQAASRMARMQGSGSFALEPGQPRVFAGQRLGPDRASSSDAWDACGQTATIATKQAMSDDRAVDARDDGRRAVKGYGKSRRRSGRVGARGRDVGDGDAAEGEASGPYSQAQRTYRDEIEFARARDRKKKLGGALKIVAFIALMPVLLIAVFLVSYTVTCILNGASPEQVVELLGTMLARVEGFARDLVRMVAGATGEVGP